LGCILEGKAKRVSKTTYRAEVSEKGKCSFQNRKRPGRSFRSRSHRRGKNRHKEETRPGIHVHRRLGRPPEIRGADLGSGLVVVLMRGKGNGEKGAASARKPREETPTDIVY